ncbi:MAG: carboxymuconolactone decarboxylase family protein [Actinomycetota bacterium]
MSRIKLIESSQVSGELADIYAELQKTRGGTVPNLFMAMGYSAAMLGPAMKAADFVTTESKVSVKYKQLAYLATSRLNQCEYCLVRHSVAGLKAGLTEAQIATFYQEGDLASHPVFDRREQAIIRFAEELTRTAQMNHDSFNAFREFFSDEEIVEVAYCVSVANMFNRLVSGLGIELEPEMKTLNFAQQ